VAIDAIHAAALIDQVTEAPARHAVRTRQPHHGERSGYSAMSGWFGGGEDDQYQPEGPPEDEEVGPAVNVDAGKEMP
jgi:hypothetical protein